MRKKNFTSALLLAACSFAVSYGLQAQITSSSGQEERSYQADSVQTANDIRQSENRENERNLSDLKSQRLETKEQAKEAREIERDANDAARESLKAYKNEKQAQRARKQADKQAKKAARARKISHDN